jgi:uncharacterized protein YceK
VLRMSQMSRDATLHRLVLSLTVTAIIGTCGTVLAADVPCRFKAETETTEIHIITDGKIQWAGSIEKLQTKTISIPEGPFTVISMVYNPNLKNKENIRTDSHTRFCRDQKPLIVPLFALPKEP